MKPLNLAVALALSGLLSACDQNPSKPAQQEAAPGTETVADTSPVLATVNDSPITEGLIELYEKQLQARRPGSTVDQNRAAILEEVINLELARQNGEAQGLDKDGTIQLQFDQQRRALVAAAAIQHELDTHPISDEELRKIYQEQALGGPEYKARHILVEEEAEARRLIGELDTGADFSKLAKEHSTGPSGKNGGELGWFSPKQMVAPFSAAVADMEKGTYTQSPVKTQFGWHVIILDDTREATPPPFEQLKPQLQMFVQKQRVQDYLAKLRQAARIEIKEQSAASGEQTKPDAAPSADSAP